MSPSDSDRPQDASITQSPAARFDDLQAAIRASRYLGIAPWDLLQRPEWLAACLHAIDVDRHRADVGVNIFLDERPMPPVHRSIRSLFSDPSPHEEPTDGYDDTSGA